MTGMVINLVDLKEMMKKVIDQLDHKHLDLDVPALKDTVTTTENLAVFLFDRLAEELSARNLQTVRISKIKVRETKNNSVVYRGPLEIESSHLFRSSTHQP